MKKTFKHFICLFVAILCFGQVWATDYTFEESTFASDKLSSTVNDQTFTFSDAHGGAGSNKYADGQGGKYIKISAGKTVTITFPTGFVASNINIKGYTNKDNESNGELSEVAGVSQSGKTFPSRNSGSISDYDFAIASNATSVTFKTKGNTNQVCLLITITGTPAGGGEDPGDDPGDDPESGTCPTSGSVYTASTAATGNISISTTDGLELDASTHKTTVTGGKMYVISKQSSGKNLITNGAFCHTNNDTYFKLEFDCALEAGDVISVSVGKDGSNERGVWVSTATSRPSSAPACALTAKNSSLVPQTYTVTSTDEYVGKKVLYVYRATGNTTYFNNISITRPDKYDVTYYKNDGSDASTVAMDVAVVGDNTFTRSGYRFIEWNTQADGKGTKVNVGAAVTADIELYAIWAQEYSVSYANTGAASGAAPTNTNKYITGEKFKVAGVGSMVAAENYVFSGWNDGTATYEENADYTVGAANVSFTPVWVLSYTVTYKANGGTKASGAESSDIVANNPSTIAQCQFLPADGKVFLKWNTQADGKGVDYLPGASISTTIELYAQYQTVSCDNRQTLTKAVLTSASEATVTGYNNDEFAGAAKLASLGGSSGTSTYDFGEGEVTGYKLASGGNSHFLATLSKGSFQAGDQVKIAITTSSANSRLDICAGTDKANMLEVIRLKNITAPGIYAYTLTSADATAINTAGYKSIGIFRASGENTNAYIYSVEITGCRNWSIYHTLTFKNVDGTATIATENLAEGDLAGTVAPSAPVVDDKYFSGWSESIGGTPVDMSAYTITEDKILYAVYEDCPTYGTVFKFNVATNLTSGNMFATAPLSATALTTENFLSELVGGEMEVSNTNSKNNRIVISDQKAIGFANGTGGKITIALDCPLQENDEIRFINYAKADNSITLSDGTNSTTLDGNGNTSVQTFIVPEVWETGSHELTMVRASGTSKLTYFEIYRRPVLTSVTLENMNLKVGKTGTPVMTLNPEDALVTSQAWEITTSTATGTTIDASTGLITAGETTGEITVKVTLNGDKEATCTVKVVAGFEAPRPVTETTIWDWEPVATATDGPSITAPDTVLANYLAGDEWEMLAGNSGGRPYRSTTYKAYQGTSLYFNAEVPGMLRIYAGSTGNDKKVYVNGIEVGTTGPKAYLNNIVVPAGDVYITSESMRIYWMKFDTDLSAYELTDNVLGGYERAVTEGRYGTICLPKAGVMVGAAIFEVAYLDNNDPYKKIFFDEVISGEMVAGRPYIFLPNEGVSTIGVFYTDDTEETAGNYRGLFGSYTQEVLATDGTNYILLNNQYCRVANLNTSVGANRAYFKIGVEGGVPTNAVAPAPGRRRVSMSAQGEQVATGMEEAQSDNLQCAKIVIDGHFFILRGEKMYDATGRLVK